jgi:hypothetical protein
MLRRLDAAPLRGRRVRLTGHLRTEAVTGQAVLWMRVDDADGVLLVRTDTDAIEGTHSFARRRPVLDVPAGGARLVFGCRLRGGGAITARGFALEVVSKRVAQTRLAGRRWHATGSAPDEYEMRSVDASGGGSIHARSGSPSGFATIMRNVRADAYRGRRVRFMADVELDGVVGSAGLWMRVDAEDGKALAYGSTQKRGTGAGQPWQISRACAPSR